MIPNKELFVDTGVNTGWAYFTGTKNPCTGEINCNKKEKETLELYIKNSSIKFEKLLKLLKPEKIKIELPEYWSTFKGETSAKSGSLMHLASNAFTYANVCVKLNIEFKLLTAFQWKGTMSKSATIERVFRINGFYYKTEHITDAVGMGLSRDINLWLLEK